MLRQNVAMAHVLGLACMKASMSCRKLRPASTAVRAANPLAAIVGVEVAEECHGRVDLRLFQRPPALFRVREKRSSVAVGEVASPSLHILRRGPGKTRRCQSRTPYCRIRSSRPAPRSSLCALGPARVSSDFIPPTARACWGAPGWGAPSPAMPVVVCDGGPSEGRGLQRLDARRLLVVHDEGAVV